MCDKLLLKEREISDGRKCFSHFGRHSNNKVNADFFFSTLFPARHISTIFIDTHQFILSTSYLFSTVES